MNERARRYLGRWELVPELSLYESGDPPRRGTYVLEANGDDVAVEIDWIDGEGESGAASYGGPTDGSEIAIDAPGSPKLTMTHVNEGTLESAVYVGGNEVAWAQRRASADGELLSVVQAGRDPEGQPFRNFQVYRRVGD
ncbi:MAG: hypothetical protein AAGA81_10910 [Acidobacteriota bacterium]